MSKIDCRGAIMDKSGLAEDFNLDDDVINEDFVKEFCDNLESKVNAIIKMLEPIKGLSEIDDVRYALEELASDLY